MLSAHDDDAALWIALNQIPGLGSAGICRLLAAFKSPESIFSASISQLKQYVDEDIAASIHQGVDPQAIEPTLQWLRKDHAHLITLADTVYPKSLLEIDNPPPILYAYGHLEMLSQPGIAIVGSRHSTPQGEKNAEDFAQSLCDQGICIISGMALGIDGAAHRGAIKSHGHTIAVVGTGLDIVYPAKHRALAHQIAERGLLLSEFPLGTPSKAQNFPRRNRIISGLSLGCLVVEANIESGSLITARLAAEQGREVFAIPGSIHSPVSKGCHQLIKQGAKLVESTSDIMDELKNMLGEISPNGSIALSDQTGPEANPLLVSMGFDPVSFDTLLSLSGLTIDRLSAMLTMLELEGKITNINGGKYQRLL